MAPARLLTACLTELGFSAHTADCMDSSEVTADDALVVFDLTGSESLWRLVEPALKARPILLAVAAGTLTSPVAKQADVAVTLPIWPSPSWRDQPMLTTGLQLMCFLIVDAIRLNLLKCTRCNA